MAGGRRTVVMASPGGRRGRGGMASLVTYLADALPRRLPALRCEILDTYGPGAIWPMPFWFAASLAAVLARRIAGRIDLLHVHMACYGSAVRKPILAAWARALGIDVVLHLHGAELDEYWRGLPRWRRGMLAAVLRSCARVVVIGEHWRNFTVADMGLDPRKVVLVRNGVPRADRPRTPRPPGAPVRLLMLGELGPRKGTPELIAALAAPEVRRLAWTATLAGDGPIERYRAEVARMGLAERVALPGWRTGEEVRALLAEADVLVLPSRQEGLPVAILEAMAYGAAVIATPVGAVPDAIRHGETGLLVPPGDTPALAAAIANLVADGGLRARLAAAAKRRYEEMFTIERTADDTAAMYRELGIA